MSTGGMLFLGQLVYFLDRSREDHALVLARGGFIETFENGRFGVRPAQASSPTRRPIRVLDREQIYTSESEAHRALMVQVVDRARALVAHAKASTLDALVNLFVTEELAEKLTGPLPGPSPLDQPFMPASRTPLRALLQRIRDEQTGPIGRSDVDIPALQAKVRARLLGPEASEEEVSAVTEQLVELVVEPYRSEEN